MKTLKSLIPQEGSGKFLHTYKAMYDCDGKELPYEIVSRNPLCTLRERGALGSVTNAVCIIPIFENGDVLATREFRYAINDYCLEFPAGLIDSGESAEYAPIRELKEETGLDARRVLFSIPGGYSSAGMTDEKVAIVGLLVTGRFHDVEGKEEIHSFRTSPRVLFAMIQRGEKCSSRMQSFLLGTQFNLFV